jgi:acyl-coenzyme A thioesterase PaaI-like protein
MLDGGLAPSLACLGARMLAPVAASGDASSMHVASLHVSYVSAAVEQDIRCESRLLRGTSSVNFVESRIVGEDGTRIANAQSTVCRRSKREQGQTAVERIDGPIAPGTSLPVPASAPFLHHLGFELEERTDGRSRLRLRYREELGSGAGFHEAALLALFDVAGAMSSHAACGRSEPPMRAATIALQASGLTPSLPAEDVVGVSRCIRWDGDFFWNDVRIATAGTREVLMRGVLVYRIAPIRGALDERR